MRLRPVVPLLASTILTCASPAVAQDHCFTPPDGTVRATLTTGGEGTLVVAPDGGIIFRIGGVEHPCEATRDSADTVRVQLAESDADETLVVDHGGAGGPFSQVIVVELGGGADTVVVHGTNGKDMVDGYVAFIAESTEVRQNLVARMYDQQQKAWEESRVNMESPENIVLMLAGGADTFNAPTVSIPVLVNGGSGNDRLTGGTAGDQQVGGPGDDRLVGGGGNDVLNGGKGEDICKGGPGKDKEKGCE